jgi:uncharacterized membrane protein YkoI
MVTIRMRTGMVAAAALATQTGAARGGCIPDWSVAAPLVKKEGLVTVEQLTAMARSELAGDIVKTTLCEEKGGYVFRLVVRAPDGQLKSVTVDARTPFKR